MSPRMSSKQYLARQQSAAANEDFNVSHILLSLPAAATPQQLEEISHKAQDVAVRAGKVRTSVSWPSPIRIAKQLGRRSAGWRKGTQLPQFILDLVVKMKPGEVSEPSSHAERLPYRETE